MKPLALAAVLLALSGCAAQPTQECRSLQCELDLAAAEIADECSTQLFFYPARQAKLIDAQYQYPYTNYDTYMAMTKVGSRVPSPREWCEAYAAFRMEVQLPPSQS